MAIFHMNAKVISRGKGQSAIAAAAYRSGERLRDEQAGEQKFYQSRAERIEFTAVMVPSDAPEWARDRNQLWNGAERAEKRKDAQLAREIEVSLPHEMTAQQREWLVKDFAREVFVRKGYAVDIAIHAPDKESDARNHHAHLMVTMRTLDAEGFAAKKDRDLNSREQLSAWREQWAHVTNRHLERHGFDARIDHRSLKEQGIEREAGVHLGYAANEIAKRGAQSDRMDALKAIIERNDIRLEQSALDREIAALERRQEAEAGHALAWTDRAGMAARQEPRLGSGGDLERAVLAREALQKAEIARREAQHGREMSKEHEPQETRRAEHRPTAWKPEPEPTPQSRAGEGRKGLQVVDKATGAVSSLGDFMLNLVGGAARAVEPEASKPDLGAYVSDPEARKAQQLARWAAGQAERDSDRAIERIKETLEKGRHLKSEDIEHLTPAHQKQLHDKGDAYVQQMIDEARKRAERASRSEGRERD